RAGAQVRPSRSAARAGEGARVRALPPPFRARRVGHPSGIRVPSSLDTCRPAVMAVAIVGGGMLGLALAWRLAATGRRVDVLEAAPQLGGLAAPCDYGEFTWDRFYHCLLPSDEHLLKLLAELDLATELRWRPTRTGYFGGGRFHEMTGGRDFLRFPLL